MSEEPKTKKPRAPKTPKAEIQLRPGLPKKEDGSYDWRKIVSSSNIILNKNYWALHGKDVTVLEEEEIERLKKESPDEGLVIKLAGFAEIARARGVKSTRHPIVSFDGEKSVVSAEIVLLPNQDEPYEVTISGVANCSIQNSTPKFFVFAEALASNRAENRAWRRYLGISAVSDEEINPLEPVIEVQKSPEPVRVFMLKLEELGLSESDIPKIAEREKISLSEKWNGSVQSLTSPEIFTFLSKLNS